MPMTPAAPLGSSAATGSAGSAASPRQKVRHRNPAADTTSVPGQLAPFSLSHSLGNPHCYRAAPCQQSPLGYVDGMGHRKGCSQGEAEGSGRGIGHCSMILQYSLTSRPLGAAEKPGACPAAAPERLIAPCSFPCLEDKDCLGEQKCCPLGCGSACSEPAQGKHSAGTAASPASPQGPCWAIAVPLTPWPLGQHTQLSLLLKAAGKTQRRNVAAGTGNVRVTARTRDPRGRQGGQWGMLNGHTSSALSDQPKPSEGPTVQPGPFRERCRGDGDCPDAQKCCNSSCGQQCLPGEPAGETGWDSTGQDGQ